MSVLPERYQKIVLYYVSEEIGATVGVNECLGFTDPQNSTSQDGYGTPDNGIDSIHAFRDENAG
jgi:hypothetical protein